MNIFVEVGNEDQLLKIYASLNKFGGDFSLLSLGYVLVDPAYVRIRLDDDGALRGFGCIDSGLGGCPKKFYAKMFGDEFVPISFEAYMESIK